MVPGPRGGQTDRKEGEAPVAQSVAPPHRIRLSRRPITTRISGLAGFQLPGRGGGSIEPPKTGGGQVGKRAQLTGPLISDDEVWRQRRRQFFWPLKMVNSPPPTTTKYMANDDCSELSTR